VDHAAAGADDAELVRGGVGQVDQAVADEGTAVVDAHDHRAAVGDVGDPHITRDRQHRVRGGHRVHVIGLAGGGRLAVITASVPGRDAARPVGFEPGHRRVAAAHDRVRPLGAAVQGFDFRYRIGDGGDIGGRMGAGSVV